MRLLLIASLLAAPCADAFAARPMTIDDARIVDAKACQVESWRRFNRAGEPETWVVPACTPIDNLEISFGAAKGHDAAGTNHLASTLLQAKTLVRELTPNGFGWGLTLGRTENRLLNAGETLYLNLPASWSFSDDAVLVHANLGMARGRIDRRTRATWGVGTEVQWEGGMQLIGELFGEGATRPSGQAGVRMWLVPNRVEVDATYGGRLHANPAHRFFTLGVRWISPAFLP